MDFPKFLFDRIWGTKIFWTLSFFLYMEATETREKMCNT